MYSDNLLSQSRNFSECCFLSSIYSFHSKPKAEGLNSHSIASCSICNDMYEILQSQHKMNEKKKWTSIFRASARTHQAPSTKHSFPSNGLKTLNCVICICNDLLQCIYRRLALLLLSLALLLFEQHACCSIATVRWVCVWICVLPSFLHICNKTTIEC